jgi:hypothetical protein
MTQERPWHRRFLASTMTARAGSTRHDRREIEMLMLLVNAMRSTGRSPEALN